MIEKDEDGITWVSANDWIERQTRRLERMYHSSRPKPRNKAMGFKGEDRKTIRRDGGKTTC